MKTNNYSLEYIVVNIIS